MPHNRAIWLAIILLAAVIIGLAGGVLSWLGGATPAGAILFGAGGLAATVLLAITIVNFMADPSQ
ncbi:hypothetical protein SAMN05216276_10864 [Streptosporangium subroseum]|uniref:Uncharacterized protein n=1 Tax=Streptosporangium subroseum TaxID=106412 RepID=A0A239P4A9_9ACTN|nr:hypothetical protein [Streptosporangium subroseum]SNT61870.1 hypothetical protein SAMN05216276_10864 [Streptosporangium subroseum]